MQTGSKLKIPSKRILLSVVIFLVLLVLSPMVIKYTSCDSLLADMGGLNRCHEETQTHYEAIFPALKLVELLGAKSAILGGSPYNEITPSAMNLTVEDLAIPENGIIVLFLSGLAIFITSNSFRRHLPRQLPTFRK